jgi:uncharacterized LabA/DUF88 family protein
MDIELAIDMLEISNYLDHVVLFSGDGDFRRLIEAVQRKAVRTTIVSTIRTSPPMIADELRRAADTFIDLETLRQDIERIHTSPPDERRRNRPPRDTGDTSGGDDDYNR